MSPIDHMMLCSVIEQKVRGKVMNRVGYQQIVTKMGPWIYKVLVKLLAGRKVKVYLCHAHLLMKRLRQPSRSNALPRFRVTRSLLRSKTSYLSWKMSQYLGTLPFPLGAQVGPRGCPLSHAKLQLSKFLRRLLWQLQWWRRRRRNQSRVGLEERAKWRVHHQMKNTPSTNCRRHQHYLLLRWPMRHLHPHLRTEQAP